MRRGPDGPKASWSLTAAGPVPASGRLRLSFAAALCSLTSSLGGVASPGVEAWLVSVS